MKSSRTWPPASSTPTTPPTSSGCARASSSTTASRSTPRTSNAPSTASSTRPASRARYCAGIKSVTVVEPYTVKFELKSPSATFLSYLATNPNGCIVPSGVTDLKTNRWAPGPSCSSPTSRASKFTLKANPAYYEDRQPLPTPWCSSSSGPVLRWRRRCAQGHRHDLVQGPARLGPDRQGFQGPGVGAGKTSRTFPVWFNIKAKPFSDVRAPRP